MPNQKMKVTIDSGRGGELREHVMDRITLEKILSMAASSLTILKNREGSLPWTEAETLRVIREIQYQWKMP